MAGKAESAFLDMSFASRIPIVLAVAGVLLASVATAQQTPFSAVAAMLDGGRFDDVRILAGTGKLTPDARLLAAVHLNDWSVAPDLPAGQGAAWTSDYWYARGILAARAAWPGGREAQVADARLAAEQLELLSGPDRQGRRASLRRVAILAAVAAAQEERDELTLLLTHATFLDEQLRGVGAPDDDILPVDELSGDLWQQVDRYEDARRAYGQAILRRPDRTRAWIGLARACRDGGHREEARDAARTVLAAWEQGQDAKTIGEMRDILKP